MNLNLLLDGGTDAGVRGDSFFESALVGDRLFFELDSVQTIAPRGLWVTNGLNEQGTFFLTDLPTNVSSNNWFSPVNDTLFFTKYTEQFGNELWKSDGTISGTQIVKDIKPGSSNPVDLVAGENTLYFTINNSDTGRFVPELWKSDGTENGTEFVTVFPERVGRRGSRSRIKRFITIEDTLYFVSGDVDTSSVILWKYDETGNEVELVYDFGFLGLGNNFELYNFGDELYITGSNSNGQDLWRSDGTTDGTQLIKSVDFQNTSASTMYGFTYVDGDLFFGHNDGETGYELWKTDGTSEGTQLVKDLNTEVIFEGGFSSPASSFPIPISASIDDNFFFFVPEFTVIEDNGLPRFSSLNNVELWKSDGTDQGTVLVTDSFLFDGVLTATNNLFSYVPNTPTFTTNLIAKDDRLLFTGRAKEGTSFPELGDFNRSTGLWSIDTNGEVELVINPEDFSGDAVNTIAGIDLVTIASRENTAYYLTEYAGSPDRDRFWSLDLNDLDDNNPTQPTNPTNPIDPVNPIDGGGDSLLNQPLNRFRSKVIGGTYLFATQEESRSIQRDFSNVFELEGEAFKVSLQNGDNLTQFNRFQNKQTPGTYLFATEEETADILDNFGDVFELEGIAFYAYGAGSNEGQDIYRLRNTQVAGTYLFVNQQERNSALANFPETFIDEGIAFEVG